MVAFIDGDGIVRLEPLVEGLVDDLAEPPVCSWCAVEVSRVRMQGGLTWVHRRTGLLVCSGQVVGGWGPLRQAAPVEWRVAVTPRRMRGGSRGRDMPGIVDSRRRLSTGRPATYR